MNTLKELYLEAARVAEMTEDTRLTIVECVKLDGKFVYGTPNFTCSPGTYEFALAIVEGKPVFRGDVLYYRDMYCRDGKMNIFSEPQDGWNSLSWNPPKPKTVMVELLVEDAEYLIQHHLNVTNIHIACRKALEGMKS